jgi:hypothetical protein
LEAAEPSVLVGELAERIGRLRMKMQATALDVLSNPDNGGLRTALREQKELLADLEGVLPTSDSNTRQPHGHAAGRTHWPTLPKFIPNQTNVFSFLSTVDSLLRAHSVPAHEKVLAFARCVRDNDVHISVWLAANVYDPGLSYPEAQEAFRERFAGDDDDELARDELDVLKQVSSVVEYQTRFEMLCARSGVDPASHSCAGPERLVVSRSDVFGGSRGKSSRSFGLHCGQKLQQDIY